MERAYHGRHCSVNKISQEHRYKNASESARCSCSQGIEKSYTEVRAWLSGETISFSVQTLPRLLNRLIVVQSCALDSRPYEAQTHFHAIISKRTFFEYLGTLDFNLGTFRSA